MEGLPWVEVPFLPGLPLGVRIGLAARLECGFHGASIDGLAIRHTRIFANRNYFWRFFGEKRYFWILSIMALTTLCHGSYLTRVENETPELE